MIIEHLQTDRCIGMDFQIINAVLDDSLQMPNIEKTISIFRFRLPKKSNLHYTEITYTKRSHSKMSENKIEKEPKKMSLQEAVKQRLAQKKQQGSNVNPLNGNTSTKKLSSQQTKKANNQRRRTGV